MDCAAWFYEYRPPTWTLNAYTKNSLLRYKNNPPNHCTHKKRVWKSGGKGGPFRVERCLDSILLSQINREVGRKRMLKQECNILWPFDLLSFIYRNVTENIIPTLPSTFLSNVLVEHLPDIPFRSVYTNYILDFSLVEGNYAHATILWHRYHLFWNALMQNNNSNMISSQQKNHGVRNAI